MVRSGNDACWYTPMWDERWIIAVSCAVNSSVTHLWRGTLQYRCKGIAKNSREEGKRWVKVEIMWDESVDSVQRINKTSSQVRFTVQQWINCVSHLDSTGKCAQRAKHRKRVWIHWRCLRFFFLSLSLSLPFFLPLPAALLLYLVIYFERCASVIGVHLKGKKEEEEWEEKNETSDLASGLVTRPLLNLLLCLSYFGFTITYTYTFMYVCATRSPTEWV